VIERFNLRSFGRLRFNDLHRASFTNLLPRSSRSAKIVHAATALEVWELRQSLGFTDPLGIRDLEESPKDLA
jgi:hypothetical protein